MLLGHAYIIPTMQFFTGISRKTVGYLMVKRTFIITKNDLTQQLMKCKPISQIQNLSYCIYAFSGKNQ